MPRDHRMYLDDIIEAIQKIRSYVQDMDETAFIADRKTQDAVIRNLEIAGKAADGRTRRTVFCFRWRLA